MRISSLRETDGWLDQRLPEDDRDGVRTFPPWPPGHLPSWCLIPAHDRAPPASLPMGPGGDLYAHSLIRWRHSPPCFFPRTAWPAFGRVCPMAQGHRIPCRRPSGEPESPKGQLPADRKDSTGTVRMGAFTGRPLCRRVIKRRCMSAARLGRSLCRNPAIFRNVVPDLAARRRG